MRYTFEYISKGKKYRVSATIKSTNEETVKYLFRGYLQKYGIVDVQNLVIVKRPENLFKDIFG